jgi:hypothetical protein
MKDYAENTQALRASLAAGSMLNAAEAAGASAGVLARLALKRASADAWVATLRRRGAY